MNKVTFLDHTGFVVTLDNVLLVFDYYSDPAHALHKALEQHPDMPVIFLVTHHHEAHLNKSIFELAQNHRRVYVMSNDVYPQNVPDTLEVAGMSRGDVIDNLPGGITVRAYGAEDKGVSFEVTTSTGEVIFHAGDFNGAHVIKDETSREVAKDNAEFKTLVNRIAEEMPAADIAFFPVDNEDRVTYFLSAVKVKDFFPMRFYKTTPKECVTPRENTSCHCLHTPGQSINLS